MMHARDAAEALARRTVWAPLSDADAFRGLGAALALAVARGFIAGGVGFQGLNRGVFATMVPRGHEAELFALWTVAIKALSWLGPLADAALNPLSMAIGHAHGSVYATAWAAANGAEPLSRTTFHPMSRPISTSGARADKSILRSKVPTHTAGRSSTSA